MEACGLREVWFLVNPDPGHKTGVTGLSDRLAMARLALEGEAGLVVGEIIPHRLADFEHLMGKYPQAEFVFIIGADVLSSMRAWEDYEPAVARVRFAVAHRYGAPAFELDSGLQAEMFDFDEYASASSRVIQEELAAGRVPAELDGWVYEYIRDHGLYRG
jgi:nicotinic acid mononucleotide adenylyltransferase